MNIGDALSTYYWVTKGVAEELNPIALVLLNIDPTLFLLVKFIFGSVCLLLLWSAHKKYNEIINTVTFCWLIVHIAILFNHSLFLFEYVKNS